MCGALKRARLVHPGMAEVVFVKKEDAITAYKKYNNRCLDGRCEPYVEGRDFLSNGAAHISFICWTTGKGTL